MVPEMRGRGYGGAAGRALVRDLALREGWKRIGVDPQQENILAHRFWRKLGFVQTEEITSEGNFGLVYGGSSHQRPDGEYL